MTTLSPLTDTQIETLFAFVKSKYVKFYDVQLELVDHLASEVEQRMAAQPGLTFEAALQSVYARFGIFGFTEVLEERQKALYRRNRILWWRHFQRLFRLPMLIGTLTGALLLYIAFDFLKTETFLIANGVLAVFAHGIALFNLFKIQPRKGYKLTSFYYQNTLHLGTFFNVYQSFFISYNLILPLLPGTWLLLIPVLCWLGWSGFCACVLAYRAMLTEQQKLYPMAFA